MRCISKKGVRDRSHARHPCIPRNAVSRLRSGPAPLDLARIDRSRREEASPSPGALHDVEPADRLHSAWNILLHKVGIGFQSGRRMSLPIIEKIRPSQGRRWRVNAIHSLARCLSTLDSGLRPWAGKRGRLHIFQMLRPGGVFIGKCMELPALRIQMPG